MQQQVGGGPDRRETRGTSQAFSALQHRGYRWYWISGLGMTGAQGINQLTVAWLVLDLTGSVGQLGLVIFFQGLPTAVVALFGGVFADRYSRKALLIWTQAFTTANLAALGFLTISGLVEVWMVYFTSVMLGVAMALSMPARQALIRSLVPIEAAMNAVALNSMQQQSSRIIWPSLAGGMITWFGVGTTIAFSAGLSAAGLVFFLMVRGFKEDRLAAGGTVLRGMFEGMRYAFTTPTLNRINMIAISIGAFGLAFMTLGPGFAREELHFSAGETGLFIMSSGLGALLGSSFLVAFDVKDRYRLFVTMAFCFGITLVLLSLNPWNPAAFLFMAFFGVCTTSLSITAQTIYQVTVPPKYLGRVTSTFSIGGGIGQMTALPIGLIGDEVGLRWPLGGVAVILMVIVFLIGPNRSRKPAEAAPVAVAAPEA